MNPAATIGIIIGVIIAIVVGLIAYSYTQIQLSLENISYQGLDVSLTTGSISSAIFNGVLGNWLGAILDVVTGVKIGLGFGLSNHGFFPVYIPDVSYNLFVNDIAVGQGQSHIDQTINAGETRSIEDTQDIQFSSLKPAVTSIVASEGMINLKVSGTAYFNLLGISVPVPFEATKQVNVVDELKNQVNNYISQNQQYSQQQSYQGNQASSNPYQSSQQQTYQPTQPIQESVSVITDKTSYNYGDTIFISGSAYPADYNQNVLITVIDPSGNSVPVCFLGVGSDGGRGSFSCSIGTGSYVAGAGIYRIEASYAGAQSQTTFSYSGFSAPSITIPQTSQSGQQQIRYVISYHEYQVGPNTYTYIPFNMQCAGTLTGRFSAQAALGDNIIAYVVDPTGFRQLQSGSNFYAYYNSGKVASGTINIGLSSGQYYLILSNTYSTISTKNVNLETYYTCS